MYSSELAHILSLLKDHNQIHEPAPEPPLKVGGRSNKSKRKAQKAARRKNRK